MYTIYMHSSQRPFTDVSKIEYLRNLRNVHNLCTTKEGPAQQRLLATRVNATSECRTRTTPRPDPQVVGKSNDAAQKEPQKKKEHSSSSWHNYDYILFDGGRNNFAVRRCRIHNAHQSDIYQKTASSWPVREDTIAAAQSVAHFRCETGNETDPTSSRRSRARSYSLYICKSDNIVYTFVDVSRVMRKAPAQCLRYAAACEACSRRNYSAQRETPSSCHVAGRIIYMGKLCSKSTQNIHA